MESNCAIFVNSFLQPVFNTMRKAHENTYVVYLLTDDLLHIVYKKGKCIDLKAAQLIVRDRMMLQEGKEMPILCDIREIRKVNKSARDYFALEGSLWITALAFLIDPPVTDMISVLYLATHALKVPTQSFISKSDALAFLRAAMVLCIIFLGLTL